MRRNCLSVYTTRLVAVVFCFSFGEAALAQPPRPAGSGTEAATARYFESIRTSPPQMLAFLRRMPKGGDLHNHLSGAIYAESYVTWAAEKGLCITQATSALSTQSPCDPATQVSASAALTDPTLYRKLVDAWSMRNWQYSGQSGHDQFFDTFGRFGAATFGNTGKMLAEVASRAAAGRISYLELMLTPDGITSSGLGRTVGWDGDPTSTLSKLRAAGIPDAVPTATKTLRDAEAEKNKILSCGTPRAEPGCAVMIRYIYQVGRAASLGSVFAQMVTGFALANDPTSTVVGLNLVQPEDAPAAMQNFGAQMAMLDFLRPLYPNAKITLHAGELSPGIVPPSGMTFHIRDSIMKGHAVRIGHGVSIMNEDDPEGLLREMARSNILVEICLTSNDVILGISRERHPLKTYLTYGVPVSLATDDEGVSRSEITREYLKAAEEQGLGYTELKTMARNSLQYGFLAGASLWSNGRKFVPTVACARDNPATDHPSDGCRQFLASSEKARLQWRLEQDLSHFESIYK